MRATDQLDALRRLPGTWDRDRTAIDGPGDPPEHVRLAALLSPAGNPAARLADAIRPYLAIRTDWPFRHLQLGEPAPHVSPTDGEHGSE